MNLLNLKLKDVILIIAVLIACVTLSTSLLKGRSHRKEIDKLIEQHKIELAREIGISERKIQSLLIERDSLIRDKQQDSVRIKQLEQSLITADKRVERNRQEVKKLTTDEKVDWLIRRYSSSN